jgi:hypothetical protein
MRAKWLGAPARQSQCCEAVISLRGHAMSALAVQALWRS